MTNYTFVYTTHECPFEKTISFKDFTDREALAHLRETMRTSESGRVKKIEMTKEVM